MGTMNYFAVPGLPTRGMRYMRSKQDIIDAVINVTGLNIYKKNRTPEYVRARSVCFYVLYNYGGISFPEIGREFAKDHTTIMNGVRLYKSQMQVEDEIYQDISAKVFNQLYIKPPQFVPIKRPKKISLDQNTESTHVERFSDQYSNTTPYGIAKQFL